MNNTMDWNNFKTFTQGNTLTILYKNTVYYCSNDPNVPDQFSYSLETAYNGIEFYCTIIKDGGQDQIDFETNFKPSAIELI